MNAVRNLLRCYFVFLSLCFVPRAECQLSVRVLHSFSGGPDGQEPYAGLVQGADQALYGTTFQGGTNQAGLMFKVRPDGSGNAPLFSFEFSGMDPGGVANPSGLIQGADGALYGTTGLGGAHSQGSVFRINPDGTGYMVLRSFDAGLGGPYEPTAALVQGNDGFLYGTTQFGGVLGAGAVFKVSTNGTGYATLHQFGIGTDGQSPQASLIQGLDGALYGTTALGGAGAQAGASGFGTVYKLNTDGLGETVLHSFMPGGGDGQYPYTAGLVQGKDGVLYGMTQQGGSTASNSNSGYGTVFKLNPDGTGFNILHNFKTTTSDGQFPNSTLLLSHDGVLYGATESGGSYSNGLVFSLNTDGTGYRVLYEFGASPTDGRYPAAPLVQANDGGLFGTTKAGGANNLGTVFRLAPAAPLISFPVPLPDKTVRLSVRAASNFVFRIEGSSDYRNWVALTNLLNVKGSIEFIDCGASNAPNRFYRAAWVP